MSVEKQFRATFEDTKAKQKLFRHRLDVLITENRPLKVEERDSMFDLYDDANLGLGGVETVLWLSDGKRLEIPNLEKFIRDLFEYDSSVVTGDFFFFSLGRYRDITLDIAELWKQIKSKTNSVAAEALTQALRVSKEREKTIPGRGINTKDV